MTADCHCIKILRELVNEIDFPTKSTCEDNCKFVFPLGVVGGGVGKPG